MQMQNFDLDLPAVFGERGIAAASEPLSLSRTAVGRRLRKLQVAVSRGVLVLMVDAG
jgi:hypothetical protein